MEQYLITGGGGGIGRAIALKLAGGEKRFWLTGRNADKLKETARLVEQRSGEAHAMVCDLTDTKQIDDLIRRIGREPLSALIHNAGIAVVKPFEEVTPEEWERQNAVNLTAPFLLTRGLLPNLGEGSSIVSILSVAARTPFANWSSYCAGKFGLDGFTRSIREELRPRGIRVINFYPQATATDIWDAVPGDWPKENMLAPEQVAEAVAFALSRPSSVLVEDIALGNLGGNL